MKRQNKYEFETTLELKVEIDGNNSIYTLKKYIDELIIKEDKSGNYEIIYIKNGIQRFSEKFTTENKELEDALFIIKTFFYKLLPDVRIKEISDEIMRELSERYILVKPEEIRLFLSYNPDLVSIILEAYEHIKRISGDVKLYLELFEDYDYPDLDSLHIIIKTDYPYEKVEELEDKLYNEWFSKISDKVGIRLYYMVEGLYDD